MRYVPTPIACLFTGLSTDKLREWTARRALVPADVRPKGKGSPARFSWQTILTLRVAVLLHDRFSLALQSHKPSFARLRTILGAQSFIGLWGKRLVIGAAGHWTLIDVDARIGDDDALVIGLDPHLAVLRDGFALPAATGDDQLDLFTLPAVRSMPAPRAGTADRATARQAA